MIEDKLAACERPGGYGESHRRVRRQEEIIWLNRKNFGLICSISEAPHNLHNYDAIGLNYIHHPWPARGDQIKYLTGVTKEIMAAIEGGTVVLIHKAGIGDEVMSLAAAYLLLTGKVQGGPKVSAIVERMFNRRLGPTGRAVVEIALGVLDDGSQGSGTGSGTSRPAA